MNPRYALIKTDQHVRPAWIAEDADGPGGFIFGDGEPWEGPSARVLYVWVGLPLPEATPETVRRDALKQLALKQLREQIGLSVTLDAAGLHMRLPAGEGVPFEKIAAMAIGKTAAGWDRARLYLALHEEKRLFRPSKKGFVARLPVEIRQRAERAKEERAHKAWSEKVRGWLVELQAGLWRDRGPEARRFVDHLTSLMVYERSSPHWKPLAGALGLHVEHWEENRVLLKRWLQTAGAWPGWAGVWLRRAGVVDGFPAELIALADNLARSPLDHEHRTDYRDTETYTFDSSQTTDFDDACSIIGQEDDALLVAVHITEPSPALVPGNPIFDEAAHRMASVYTPAETYPMLPPALSSGRFSMVRGEDREALTFRLRIRPRQGELLGIERSVVRVDENFDYDSALCLTKRHPETWGRLTEMAHTLAEERAERGALLVHRPQVMFDLSDPRHIRLHVIDREAPLRRLVEELAILVNREGGRYCRRHGLPAFYRVQPRARVGWDIDSAPDVPAERLTRNGAAIQAARFSLEGDEHAGLACDRYVQITSPIRRFGDLIMQRQIATHLATGVPAFPAHGQLQDWIRRAEQRSTTYNDVARRIDDEWKRRYLSQNPGIAWTGVIRKAAVSVAEKTRPAHVWLQEPQIDALAELPEVLGEGIHGRFRVTRIDHDRCKVWVEQV